MHSMNIIFNLHYIEWQMSNEEHTLYSWFVLFAIDRSMNGSCSSDHGGSLYGSVWMQKAKQEINDTHNRKYSVCEMQMTIKEW